MVAVGLGEQLAEGGGGGLVGAGLLEAPRLAGDRVGSGVGMDPKGPAGELLDVASGGGGHSSTMTLRAGYLGDGCHRDMPQERSGNVEIGVTMEYLAGVRQRPDL